MENARRALPGPFSAFPTADHNLLENATRFPQPLGKASPAVGRQSSLSHSSTASTTARFIFLQFGLDSL